MPNRNFIVVVRTYNRPHHLMRLLDDIDRQPPAGRLRLAVFDDCGEITPRRAKRRCRERGWHYVRRPQRYAKKYAWKAFNEMFAWLKGTMREHDLCVFVDDDMRLCERFFERVQARWDGLSDERAVSLQLMIDEDRADQPCWTAVKPQECGDHVRLTQWVDGAFVTSGRFFRLLDWTVKPIDAARWALAPSRSSGVGAQLSRRLVDSGARMYQVRESLVAHIGTVESFMNPQARQKHPLRAIRFVDGEAALAAVVSEPFEPLEASVASVPNRQRQLIDVLGRLRPQVDVMRVFLNGYSEVPTDVAKLADEVARSQDHGDHGDAGKFFWCDQVEGVHLTVDDDIAYPPLYARSMAEHLAAYDNRAAVGVHAAVIREPTSSYYADRSTIHFSRALQADRPVHVLGTGCLAYSTTSVTLTPKHFELPNMADIWFALACQKQGVPRYAVSRPQGWLSPLPTEGPAIYDQSRFRDEAQTRALQRVKWTLQTL